MESGREEVFLAYSYFLRRYRCLVLDNRKWLRLADPVSVSTRHADVSYNFIEG